MLFLATIFSTKLPSLAASRNGLIPLTCFTSLRTWRIFDAEYIVNINNVDLLIPGHLGAASLT